LIFLWLNGILTRILPVGRLAMFLPENPHMSTKTRRHFLRDAALGATATAVFGATRSKAAGTNERVRVAIIGCGNQGTSHMKSLTSLKDDAEIVYVCDVDRERVAKGAEFCAGSKPVSDFRKILDDKSIDGVTIATPDHWHTPIALLALDAGKHVYVEKPCCHNLREGQLLLAAAQSSGKAVAHGTQSRSNPGVQQAIKMLHDGIIGDVLLARCWNWQERKNIGHLQPSAPPSGVDYDTWVGPAEWMPFQANRFHYDWHWWYNFGCGDLGSDGIHEFDYTLWGLGVKTDSSIISGAGGKYYFDDDQQFPDTQQVTFEYPGDGKVGDRRMLIYEMRLWSTTNPYNVDSGAEFFGNKGKMFISKRGKFEVRGPRNAVLDIKLDSVPKAEVSQNQKNWLDCIRSGKQPNANMEVAVRTATAVHLGNIATRLQRTLHFDPSKQEIVGDAEASAMMSRKYRDGGHWGTPKAV
jgi:predicted dehydrogenase